MRGSNAVYLPAELVYARWQLWVYSAETKNLVRFLLNEPAPSDLIGQPRVINSERALIAAGEVDDIDGNTLIGRCAVSLFIVITQEFLMHRIGSVEESLARLDVPDPLPKVCEIQNPQTSGDSKPSWRDDKGRGE